jgi:cell division septation protein DedD
VEASGPVEAPVAPAPDTAPKVPVVASPPPVLKNDTTPVAATSASPARGSSFVIQIGAFGSEANAGTLSQRASALGYDAAVVPQVRGATTLYLVQVRGAGNAAEARQASDSLAHSLGVTAVVLRPGR